MSLAGLQNTWGGGGVAGGVASLNGLSAAVSLISPANTITITPSVDNNTIAIEAVATTPINAVDSLNGLINDVTLTSNGTLLIEPDAQTGDINLSVVFPDPPTPPVVVDSLNGVQTAVTLQSTNASVTITPDLVAHTINLEAVYPTPPVVVDSLNGVQTAVTLQSTNASITITPDLVAHTINLEAVYPSPPVVVDSLNGVQTAVTLQSTDGSISIVPDALANTIDLTVVVPPGLNLEGIYNKLGAFPAAPTSVLVAFATENVPPTSIVPDATPPTASTTPDGTRCWLYTKTLPTLAGFNWYPYNPRFGAPTAPLPIPKNNLQSLWALIQPAVNTNIYTAGVIALNAYTFDDANPPTSGFYNSRWAYSNQAGINSGQTGTNLYAGYTYLIYAYDAPRTVNVQGVGMPDSQPWGLRDPYDVRPDVNHIALPNCVIAFNPWTDGTNYRTWNGATAWVVGDTVVFSGTTGTPTGLFYVCVTNNTNVPPVSATGVPAAQWSPITPQPSTYAEKPVLALNVNGISGTTTGWGAGPLLRVLQMGYSYGPNATTTTASVMYQLN